MFPIPAPYQATPLPDLNTYSSLEFRPRARGTATADSQLDAAHDESMMSRTTVWQRLSESQSLNRVRLVTLWETGGSSLSLQAGRKGDPTLQWTSRLMNHGGAPRGLLDELFSTSVGGVVGRGLRLGSHAASTDTVGKPAKVMDGAITGTGVSK